jgi:hypothetical protein
MVYDPQRVAAFQCGSYTPAPMTLTDLYYIIVDVEGLIAIIIGLPLVK